MKPSNLEMDYIAIQIISFLNDYGHSPNGTFAQKVLVRMIGGEEIILTSAYRRLKKNINYVDDALIEKINSYPCIVKKLEKSEHKSEHN